MIKEFMELEAIVGVSLQELLYKIHQVQEHSYYIGIRYHKKSIQFYKIPKNSNGLELLFQRDLFHAIGKVAKLNDQTTDTVMRIHKIFFSTTK